MKKYCILITIIIGTLITIVIYFNMDNSKLNYLALGDGISTGMTAYHVEGYDFNDYLIEYLNEGEKLENYYKSFNETDESLNNLINKINNNVSSIDQKTKIKQAIKEADIITIAIGMDELNNYASKNNLGSTKINGYLKKYDELLNIIRNLNDKKIYIIGLYQTNLINKNKIEKINIDLENLSNEYNAEFINISDITNNQEYFLIKNNYYINYQGQEYIFNKIKERIEKSTFKII